jgi:predicted acylesterase/phospholipase RssA
MGLFDESGATPTSMEYKVSAVVGSASIPFVFPPRDMSPYGQDNLLIDGGSGWNNNMISGI